MIRNLLVALIAGVAVAALGEGRPAQGPRQGGGRHMSLADARGNIDVVIASPGAMTATMRRLSPEDQQKFLGEVNAAIAKMPGSNERRAARFVTANRAALRGAHKGNLVNMIAVVFSTATVEALTVINERFAVELFNRSASASVTFTDDQFEKIATAVMDEVREQTAKVDNSDVRNTLAALMFIRASNGSPPNLAETLTRDFEPKAREAARNEWIPAAMRNEEKTAESSETRDDGQRPEDGPQRAQGRERERKASGDYEAMLGEANAGEQPRAEVVLRMAAPQLLDTMLVDVATGIVDDKGNATFPTTDAGFGFGQDLDAPENMQNPTPTEAPGGYQWQKIQ